MTECHPPGRPRPSVPSPTDGAGVQSGAGVGTAPIQDRAAPTVHTAQTPEHKQADLHLDFHIQYIADILVQTYFKYTVQYITQFMSHYSLGGK